MGTSIMIHRIKGIKIIKDSKDNTLKIELAIEKGDYTSIYLFCLSSEVLKEIKEVQK